MIKNLSKLAIENGGKISKLLIPSENTGTTGLCNPSILIVDSKYYVNIRNVQYTLYHSEGDQKYQNHWGCLAYLNPENDITLRTTNFLCEVDPITLEVINFKKVNTQQFDKSPLWTFIGLEDARLTHWHGAFQLNGVRRDTTTNGEGRLEISQLDKDYNEVRRSRIEPPNGYTYCEKNYMPILDKPYHYVKWTDPTEVIIADLPNEISITKILQNQDIQFKRDIRGGSQIVSYKNFYVAITHEVDLWNNENGHKDAEYYHRFIVWDKDWNIVHYTDEFKFFDAKIEFCCGLAYEKNNFIMTFGFQDSTSFILKMTAEFFEELTEIKKSNKNKSLPTPAPDSLTKFTYNPNSGFENFVLANEYFDQKHYSSALSFYLRCAEFSNNPDMIYDSLLMIYKCLANQGNRRSSEKSALNNAISFDPNRPEAYLFMSYWYESNKEYHDAYSMISIGCGKLVNNYSESNPRIGYIGGYTLVFQKAVLSWWIGRNKESREMFQAIKLRYYDEMNQFYRDLLQKNITQLGGSGDPFLPYTFDKLYQYRFLFSGIEKIQKNYSQTYQDMFVLSVLKGKQNGVYLEIGSADPFYGSNTMLLEELGWHGHSIEILPDMVEKFNKNRENKCHLLDATKVDYLQFITENFGKPTSFSAIDYLQIDCEPPAVTFEILKMIPFDNYNFKVITFEHDHYADVSGEIREKSREYLRQKGYKLLVSNVSPNEFCPYEDWWVNKDFVDDDIISLMESTDDSVKQIDKYFLK